jgi:hypothetical protein
MTCRNILWSYTGWVEISFNWFFNSTLEGVERSASSYDRFIPDTEPAIPTEKGPRTSLEILVACTGKQTQISQSSDHQPGQYTDYVTRPV